MADDFGPSTIKRLKKLAEEIPQEETIRGLLRVLEDKPIGSTHPVTLIGASLVERALEAAFLSRLVPMNIMTEIDFSIFRIKAQ